MSTGEHPWIVSSYRSKRGGVLMHPTVGQFEEKPRASTLHATSDSPSYRMP
jgi:hypothetical protein